MIDDPNFQTPPYLCAFLVEELACQLPPPARILEPTPGPSRNLVTALAQRGYEVVPPARGEDYWQFIKTAGSFDAAACNPPFSPATVGYAIIADVLRRTQLVVTVLPWVSVTNSDRRTAFYLEQGLFRIVHLPRRTWPGSRTQTAVLEFDGVARRNLDSFCLSLHHAMGISATELSARQTAARQIDNGHTTLGT